MAFSEAKRHCLFMRGRTIINCAMSCPPGLRRLTVFALEKRMRRRENATRGMGPGAAKRRAFLAFHRPWQLLLAAAISNRFAAGPDSKRPPQVFCINRRSPCHCRFRSLRAAFGQPRHSRIRSIVDRFATGGIQGSARSRGVDDRLHYSINPASLLLRKGEEPISALPFRAARR